MLVKETKLNPFGLLIEPVSRGQHISEVDIAQLRSRFQREQLLVLRGFGTFQKPSEFSDYCESWGEVSIWPFGKVLELIERENPEDHIFDNSYVPMHWDGMYRSEIAEYQIFHCVKAPASDEGGRTTFSHTVLALKNATEEELHLWGRVTGVYQRKMEFYHSRVTSPVIVKHPYKDVSIIRYNEPPSAKKGAFVNPPDLEFVGLDAAELESFHDSLQAALYAPTNFYAHQWQSGDVVIADNFMLLHGREAFTSKANRHLQRVHVLSHPTYKNPGLETLR
jgi:alpha-ketoglutarate-dependent taurine dioxygenase